MEQKGEAHQPVEDASSKPLGDARPGCGAMALFGVAIFVGAFVTIGLLTPWYTRENSALSTNNYLYLWRLDTLSTSTNTISTEYATSFCDSLSRRLKAAEAFGVLSVVLSGCLIMFTSFELFLKWRAKIGCILFSVFTFTCMLITWAIMINVYLQEFCGQQFSYKNSQYDNGAGLTLYVIASVVLVLGTIFYLLNPPIPSGNQEIKLVCGIVYFVFAIFSLIGTGIGLSITQWKYRDQNDAVTEVSIWKSMANGVETLASADNCGDRMRYWYTAEVLSIIGWVVTLVCAILGGLRLCGKTSAFVLMLFGFAGSLILLIEVSFVITIYYTQFCTSQQSYQAQLFVLMPGFGLLVGGFCFLMAGSIVVAVGAFLTRTTKMSIWRFMAVLLIIDSIVLLCIGATQPQFGMTSGDNFTRLYFDSYQTQNNGVFTSVLLTGTFCTDITNMTQTAVFFIAFAIALLFVSLILALIAMKNHRRTQHASAFLALIAAVCVVIDFIIIASLYHRTYCGVTFSDMGMQLEAGFGLSVAGASTAVGAWAINFFI
jgi:intracellular septation protein A